MAIARSLPLFLKAISQFCSAAARPRTDGGRALPLAHLKLPVDADGFLPIRAPPWDPFVEAMLAGNDDYVDEASRRRAKTWSDAAAGAAEIDCLPFFDDVAAEKRAGADASGRVGWQQAGRGCEALRFCSQFARSGRLTRRSGGIDSTLAVRLGEVGYGGGRMCAGSSTGRGAWRAYPRLIRMRRPCIVLFAVLAIEGCGLHESNSADSMCVPDTTRDVQACLCMPSDGHFTLQRCDSTGRWVCACPSDAVSTSP